MSTKKSTKSSKRSGRAKPKAPRAAKPAPKPKAKKAPAEPVTSTKTGVAIPPVGESIVRTYKGREQKVEVLANGFRWNGTDFHSLTAVAKAITGAQAISGPFFFGLAPRKAKAPAAPAPAGD